MDPFYWLDAKRFARTEAYRPHDPIPEESFVPHKGEPIVFYVHSHKEKEIEGGASPSSEDKVETYVLLGAYPDKDGNACIVVAKVEKGDTPEEVRAHYLRDGVPLLSDFTDPAQEVFSTSPNNLKGQILETSEGQLLLPGMEARYQKVSTQRTAITSETPKDLQNNTGESLPKLVADNAKAFDQINTFLQGNNFAPKPPVEPPSTQPVDPQPK